VNAGGLIIMSLGVILIIIGVKGSQHNIISSLKGSSAASGNTGTTEVPGSGGGAASTSAQILPTPTGAPLPAQQLITP
jgi:hypothetical protein